MAANHLGAFACMLILILTFGAEKVATQTRTSVKWSSFLHLWMLAYFSVLTLLMSVTTAMALMLLVDGKGEPRVAFIPPSFISPAAALLGVFGFEFLLRRFIIGFGENQLDLATTLQGLLDQAVAATLKKEVERPATAS